MDEPLSTGGTYCNAAIVALAVIFGACSQTERIAAQPPPMAPSSRAAAADAGAGDAMKPADDDQIGVALADMLGRARSPVLAPAD
jgi:hypothetical protein